MFPQRVARMESSVKHFTHPHQEGPGRFKRCPCVAVIRPFLNILRISGIGIIPRRNGVIGIGTFDVEIFQCAQQRRSRKRTS